MKINEMHLRGFGNIEDREFRFSDGLNVLYGSNEAGKSTVWSGLLALLFGMDKKEEEKFRPWNSEYGASSVCFTLKDGRQYTISKKRRKSFQTEVFETVSRRDVSDLYPSVKGVAQVVLTETGMNREAFLASVMMGQDALGVEEKKSVGLRTRLSRLSNYGDETTDVKEAKKRLEQQLDAIGKGSTGSKKKLVAVKNELGELLAAYDEAQKAHERRAALSQALDTIKEQMLKGEKIRSFYQRFMAKIAWDEAKAAEEKKKEALKIEESLLKKRETLALFKDCSEELRAYHAMLWEIDQTVKFLSRDEEDAVRQRALFKESEEALSDTQKEVAQKENERKAKTQKAFWVGGALLAAGLLCALPALLVSPYFWGLLALLTVASLVSFLKLRPKKAGMDDQEILAKDRVYKEEKSRLEALERLIVSKKEELFRGTEELLNALGVTNLEEAREAVQKMEKSEAERQKLEAEIGVLLAEQRGGREAFSKVYEVDLSAEPPSWSEQDEKALEALDVSLGNIRQKEEETAQKLRELTARQAELQKELELLDSAYRHPGDLEEAIFALREEEKTLLSKKAAIETALSVLSEAEQMIQRDYIPRLNERMKEWFTKITGERYLGTFTTAQLSPEAEDKSFGRVLPEQLSRGTWDQLYLSYRLAAADLLSGEEPLPLVMDEPFAYFDDVRLERMLEALAGLSKERQIILLSCQKRELSMLREMNVSLNVIAL